MLILLFLCSVIHCARLWCDAHAPCCSRKVQLIFLRPGTCPTASFFITLASIMGVTGLPFDDSTPLFILPSIKKDLSQTEAHISSPVLSASAVATDRPLCYNTVQL
uniref:Secreted protein n=1 Tax=Arundo donax TaxID=35708 RepID=A0A0A9E6P2_ARUDO